LTAIPVAALRLYGYDARFVKKLSYCDKYPESRPTAADHR
jgi:hypothetical protein